MKRYGNLLILGSHGVGSLVHRTRIFPAQSHAWTKHGNECRAKYDVQRQPLAYGQPEAVEELVPKGSILEVTHLGVDLRRQGQRRK